MVSALSLGSTVVTYDGSVSLDDMGILWTIIEKERVKVFGTSPKFLAACMKSGFSFKRKDDYKSLRTILSTGSPLLPEHYEWIYKNFHDDIQLSSISGGTDIISCFMLGNPLLPVKVGEIQSPGLAMAIQAWRSFREPVWNEKAELVCLKPFVSMPVYFWKDPSEAKYQASYFEFYSASEAKEKNIEYRPVWRHGDFVEMIDGGGIVVHGRSDATLNPGVRIGTSEIYRVVEAIDNVLDSVVVGYPKGGDVEIILFVKVKSSYDGINSLIKKEVRENLTPRHVPHKIFEVKDIPYTRSGKKVEIAVLEALKGNKIKNRTAISNPDALDEFYKIREQNFI